MKILKPGWIERRKIVCPKCACEFVASQAETAWTIYGLYISCPYCENVIRWSDGEPYEEPMPTQTDRERLTELIADWKVGPIKDWPPFLSDYLIAHGVTFKEV